MNFIELAHDFAKIEETASRLKMIDQLASVFAKANNHEAQIIAYLSEGTLRPSYTGTQFNMATKNLLQVAAIVMATDLATVSKMVKNYSDVGEMLFQNLKNHPTHHYNVSSIYNQLIELEKISGSGSVEIRLNQLVDLLKNVSPLEAKYIVRIISKTLRLGFSTMTILDALSQMVVGDKSLKTKFENSYNMCADIGLIAYNVKRYGQNAPEHVCIKVGIPIAPAAAERLESARAIIDKIGPAVAQLKLDGFRLQVHLHKNEKSPNVFDVHFFSRNLIDMSEMFPDLVEVIKKFNIESLICEGEAIVYDEQKTAFLPFQQTVKRKRKHGVEDAAKDLPLRLYLFDVLYLNGQSLMDKSHKERRKILLSLIPKNQNTVFAIEERPVENTQELYNFFQDVLAQNLEGLVVKKILGHYIPGKRNFNWIKLKKHSEDSLDDTLDVVIMGYYSGEGKRASFGIGSFLIGVYNKNKDKFETIAKVGTGLSDEALVEIKSRCDLIKIDHQPKEYTVSESLFPDVWVRPEIVCVVKADEITRSPVHTAGFSQGQGFALRFPRFVSYRDDKDSVDCTTINEIERLFHLQSVAKNSAS
jgi:DNA ligase-1